MSHIINPASASGQGGLVIPLPLDADEPELPYVIPGIQGKDGVAGSAGAAGSPGPIGPPGLDAEEPEMPYVIPGPTGAKGATGASGGSMSVVEANLGGVGSESWRGKFTLTDAAISPTSKIMIQQAPGPYTGKGTRADEAEMDPLWCVAEPGAGQATVYWRTQTMLAHTFRPINGTQPIDLTANRPGQQNFNMDIQQVLLGRVRGNIKFNYTVA